jgi:hypothetical protein
MGIELTAARRTPRKAPPLGELLRDPSILGILASNVVTLGVAIWQHWPMVLLLWPYWLQSLVIGWYSRRRILALDTFSTEGFKINGKAVEPTEETKRFTANFFAIHYGFFHVGYMVFLLAISFVGNFGRPPDAGDWGLIGLLGLSFFLSHRGSHRRNLAADNRSERNIGSLMFLPYARVFPMHIAIIVGCMLGGGPAALLLFTALKIVADVAMHVIEHRWLQSTPVSVGPGVAAD